MMNAEHWQPSPSGWERIECAWVGMAFESPAGEPWPRWLALMFVRVFQSQTGTLPKPAQAARRFQWFSKTGKPSTKRVRLLIESGDWIDPYTQKGKPRANEGRVEGELVASEGQAEGEQETGEPGQDCNAGQAEGEKRASEGQVEGKPRAKKGLTRIETPSPSPSQTKVSVRPPREAEPPPPSTATPSAAKQASKEENSPVDQVIDHYEKLKKARCNLGKAKSRGLTGRRSKSSSSIASNLRRCLKRESVADCKLVLDWAFWSQHYSAKALRGEAEVGQTVNAYLTLSNIFASTKFGTKLEHAQQWHEANRPGMPRGQSASSSSRVVSNEQLERARAHRKRQRAEMEARLEARGARRRAEAAAAKAAR